ncbi:MAG: response regulator, partial [Calditerrivibrio sp.]|nr:response regulator [Calditerrivibrio sp.]
ECINILKDKDYDFIFMDVSMPEMDGFTTTKIIRSSDEVKNKDIPILAMTAYAFSEDREECLKSGMNGYISKPIHIDEIKKQLSTCLNLKKGVNYLQSEEKKSYEGCEQKLREFMNSDEEMHSLLSMYLNDAKIILKDIEDALISGDNLEKLSSLAHKIKGSSYNTGVDKVGEVAKNLEKSAKDGNITDVKLYIQKLKDELKSFEEWLIERLA